LKSAENDIIKGKNDSQRNGKKENIEKQVNEEIEDDEIDNKEEFDL